MPGAIRRLLFGLNREEQEEFLVQQIYRLTRWVEQTRQVEQARAGTVANPSLAEVTRVLDLFDAAKSRVAAGAALPGSEIKTLRALISRLEQAMDAPG
jgi:hypothetical protein